jgi:hypothetical protein
VSARPALAVESGDPLHRTQGESSWQAEHPEKGNPDTSGARVIIVGWADHAIIRNET